MAASIVMYTPKRPPASRITCIAVTHRSLDVVARGIFSFNAFGQLQPENVSVCVQIMGCVKPKKSPILPLI